jgi:hypothetical protein
MIIDKSKFQFASCNRVGSPVEDGTDVL